MNWTDKVAVVAGAGGGMGLAVARSLLAEGARVTLTDQKARPDCISSWPDTSLYCQGDVTDAAVVADVFAETVARFGGVNYLVNTTGVLWFDRDRSFMDTEPEVWDRVFDINLKSIVLTTRQAIPEMQKAGGGAMVHFSSIDALSGDAAPQDAYGASKAAVIRLSKSIAIQFAKDNIRSNTILPGPVLSPMQARWDNDTAAQAAVAAHVPLGRIGLPQDMADACLFLLSDKAAYITGTELVVDGGITAQP